MKIQFDKIHQCGLTDGGGNKKAERGENHIKISDITYSYTSGKESRKRFEGEKFGKRFIVFLSAALVRNVLTCETLSRCFPSPCHAVHILDLILILRYVPQKT